MAYSGKVPIRRLVAEQVKPEPLLPYPNQKGVVHATKAGQTVEQNVPVLFTDAALADSFENDFSHLPNFHWVPQPLIVKDLERLRDEQVSWVVVDPQAGDTQAPGYPIQEVIDRFRLVLLYPRNTTEPHLDDPLECGGLVDALDRYGQRQKAIVVFDDHNAAEEFTKQKVCEDSGKWWKAHTFSKSELRDLLLQQAERGVTLATVNPKDAKPQKGEAICDLMKRFGI